MTLTKLEIKQRHWKKVLDNAEIVLCACGCGQSLKNKDAYGRDKEYINGHNGRKYQDPTQHKREWNHRNRESRYQYKMQRARKLKAKLVKKFGGKCSRCGLEYDGTNAACFDFHHKDPTQKEFNVNVAAYVDHSLEKIAAEAQKCECLCAICHRIEHTSKY